MNGEGFFGKVAQILMVGIVDLAGEDKDKFMDLAGAIVDELQLEYDQIAAMMWEAWITGYGRGASDARIMEGLE